MSTGFHLQVSSKELGNGHIYIYIYIHICVCVCVLKCILSISFVLFSQAVALSDSCFLCNTEQIQGFRQTHHVS